MKSTHIQHLYDRIGFGITPKELKRLSKKSKKNVVNELFTSYKKMTSLSADTSFLENLTFKDYKDKSKRKELQKISRKKIFEFSTNWVECLKNPSEILR